MARAVTLLTVRDLARIYADERSKGSNAYLKDDQLKGLINLAIAELYDLLVNARGHEYYETEDTSIVTAEGTATYSLPTDFYQLLTLHLRWDAAGGADEEVTPLGSLGDRHRYNNTVAWDRYNRKAYRLRGNLIEFFPTPTSAVTVVLRYIPTFTELKNDTDTFEGVNGWERLVALRVATEIRMIQKLPYGDLMSMYQQERDRVEALAADRVTNEPAKIRDVYPEGVTPWWPGWS